MISPRDAQIENLEWLRSHDLITPSTYRFRMMEVLGLEEIDEPEQPSPQPLELPIDTDAYHTNIFRQIYEREKRLDFERDYNDQFIQVWQTMARELQKEHGHLYAWGIWG